MWTDSRKKLDSLTGLRAIAALSVLVEHATGWLTPFNPQSPLVPTTGTFGNFGMSLFFVLSGFVIHYNYASLFRNRPWSSAACEFLGARFARLYPLYFFCLCIGFVVNDVGHWLTELAPDFFAIVLSSLTMTQSWAYVVVGNHRLLLEVLFGLGWSVSTEWFFYCAYLVLVFAVLWLPTPRATLRAIILVSVVAVGLIILVEAHFAELVGWLQAQSIPTDSTTSLQQWVTYYSPYSRVFDFIVGVLTAHLYILVANIPVSDREARFVERAAWAAAAFIVLLGIGHLLGIGVGPRGFGIRSSFNLYLQALFNSFGAAVPLAILIFYASRYEAALSRWLSVPWLIALGDISYSIYAMHTWTLRIFIRDAAVAPSVETVSDAIFRFVVAIALTLIVASATYRLIEVPGRRYLRGKFSRPAAPRVPVEAASSTIPR